MANRSLPRAASRWVLGISAAALIVATIALTMGRASREIESLPTSERQALYQRTLETLRTSCMQATGPTVTEYCREQAAFILRFPECDRECQTLAGRFAHQPSR